MGFLGHDDEDEEEDYDENEYEICPDCRGTKKNSGAFSGATCDTCKGDGIVPRRKWIST